MAKLSKKSLSEVEAFIRDSFNEPDLEALALENIMPTITATLVACQPLVQADCLYEFSASVFGYLFNEDIPDCERAQLVDLFQKNILKIQALDPPQPHIFEDLHELIVEYLSECKYRMEARCYITQAVEFLNPHLNQPIRLIFNERLIDPRLVHPAPEMWQ